MKVPQRIITSIPSPIRKALRPIVLPVMNRLLNKYSSEMSHWRTVHKVDNGTFKNSHYERIMLAMAGEPDSSFLKGKIVGDFGCGPRGSLAWAREASVRIGIDVLADRYADVFTKDILSHGMMYVKSTEKVIPLPAECADVLFTLNAMDHVKYFPEMCREVLRILKPGGDFIGSFNIGGGVTATEPQALNEKIIQENLLNYLEVKSCRTARRGTGSDVYGPMLAGNLSYEPGQEGFLWVRGTKKG